MFTPLKSFLTAWRLPEIFPSQEKWERRLRRAR